MDKNIILEEIATRKLYIVDEKNIKKEIIVIIGKPQKFSDSTDYYCPYRIQGFGSERIKRVGGVDAVQALEWVMKIIGVELEVINKKTGNRLRWEAGGEGDFGFPEMKIKY